jgi:PEGA domain
VFALARFIRVPGAHRPPQLQIGSRATRHPRSKNRLERIRKVLPAVCGIGLAAVTGWMLAGGSLPATETLFGQLPGNGEHSAGGASVLLSSTPSGAMVRIDGATRGKTPLELRLLPGQHLLSLQHPDALDEDQSFRVTDNGAHVDVPLWRRQPDVVPLRPVYPGAALVDARFINDGQVALLINLPAQSGAPSASRELWRLDPPTGQLARVRIPGVQASVSTMVLAPDGKQVAYPRPRRSGEGPRH